MTSLGTEKLGKGRELSKGREERLVFDIITSIKGTVCIKQCLFCYRLNGNLFCCRLLHQMHEGYFTYQKVHLRYAPNGSCAEPYILEVP